MEIESPVTDEELEVLAAEEEAAEPVEEPVEKPAPEVEEKAKRLTEAERQEVCDLYAAGKMKVTQLAEKFGVTKSAISQLLKREGVIWASKVIEEVKAETDAMVKTSAERPLAFADKRQLRIEQVREESFEIVRRLRVAAYRKMGEAERMGTPIPTLKETMNVFKRLIDMQIDASNHLLNDLLEANSHVNQEELPNIIIRDLTEEEIAGMTDESEDELLLDERTGAAS